MKKKPSTTRGIKKKKSIKVVKDEVFHSSLKSLIEALAKECPKELLVEIYKFLENAFIAMKQTLLSNSAINYSDETKEKVWTQVSNIYNEILQPLEEAKKQVDSNVIQQEAQKLNFAIQQYQINKGFKETVAGESSSLYWPKPVLITYIGQKVANDVATISCKIGPMKIPYAMIDTGSNISVISDNIVRRLGLEIDKDTRHEISGYATYAYTVGTIEDIPITITDGIDSTTESDEFSVVKAEKDKNGKEKSLVILGTPWLHKIGWEPIRKGAFTVMHKGKTLSIPLSVHENAQRGYNLEKSNENSFGMKTNESSFGIKKS